MNKSPVWFDVPVPSEAEGLTINGIEPFVLSLSKDRGWLHYVRRQII